MEVGARTAVGMGWRGMLAAVAGEGTAEGAASRAARSGEPGARLCGGSIRVGLAVGTGALVSVALGDVASGAGASDGERAGEGDGSDFFDSMASEQPGGLYEQNEDENDEGDGVAVLGAAREIAGDHDFGEAQ